MELGMDSLNLHLEDEDVAAKRVRGFWKMNNIQIGHTPVIHDKYALCHAASWLKTPGRVW
jgi:hypothetical protein